MSENRLPHEKGFHISWDQIHRDSRALAWRLDGKGPDDGNRRAVVAITRGGMAPAMIVARELDIRTVDTISVMSYHAGSGAADQRREAKVLKSPDTEVMGDGTGILIVDDLVDSGKTLTQTEQAVMDTIEELGKEITVIIIAHRLSTLKKCDFVVEIDKNHTAKITNYQEIIHESN